MATVTLDSNIKSQFEANSPATQSASKVSELTTALELNSAVTASVTLQSILELE